MRVAVIVPTLGRPHRVGPLVDDVLAASDGHDVTVVFVAEAHDQATIDAVAADPRAWLVINERSPSYAGAVNTAVGHLDQPWLFAAADDLHWHPGWLDAAELHADSHDVIGTNDLANPEVLAGEHATHYLVRLSYALRGCVDGDAMFHEGYTHNWVDREFIGTAKHRGVFTPCLASVVEHVHWVWGKADMDATYAKGRDSESADRDRYRQRRHLWAGL